MSDIRVKIGGEYFTVPLIMNLATLERVGPAMRAVDAAVWALDQQIACCAFFAELFARTNPELTLPVIKERVRVNIETGEDERGGLVEAYDAILVASGFAKKKDPAPGEADPPEIPAATA